MMSDIDSAESSIHLWKEHIVRSINQDKGRTDILTDLENHDALIIMDWAMKFLPLAYREKQSDWYGQKGINWHVSVCIFKDDLDKLKHRTYAHIFDSAKQDWFSVASVLEHLLTSIKKQIPRVRTIYLRSDNAGCYHCGNLWLALHGRSERTGLHIMRYDYSESQCGKSYCDAKIAHMRGRIRQYVSSGNNVRSAKEMKAAIDSFGGIVGCQAAVVQIDLKKQTCYSHSPKGITKINNIYFNQDGSIRTWRAYGIGDGTFLSKEDVSRMSPTKQSETGLIILEVLKQPDSTEGSVRNTVVASSDNGQATTLTPVQEQESSTSNSDTFYNGNVLQCPEEGCSRVFLTFSGLEAHLLVGKHKFVLNKTSSFDSIKLNWKDVCETLADTMSFTRNSESHCDHGDAVLPKGWALRKDRKINRFSEKVKTFLRGIFEAGQSGNKVNPMDAANHMRVCMDEDGNKMFQPNEYLQQGQIASYFSRLAVMSKVPPSKRQTIDDADLESIVAHLNSVEILNINV